MSSRAPTTQTRETASRPSSDTVSAANVQTARLILRLDGLFEGLLGVLLVSSPITGLAKALALPAPAITAVLIGFGVLLLPLLPFLWVASRTPRRQLFRLLALANGAGSLIFAAWVILWHASFNRPGAIFVLAVAAILGILAALQARIALIT